jgi:hypothetical protein
LFPGLRSHPCFEIDNVDVPALGNQR